MAGSKLVLPGPHLDGASVCTLMRDERVSFSQGVPTVWLMLFQHVDANPGLDPKELGLERVGIGGSAVPRAMLERFETQFGAEVVQGWGMSETSPIGVISKLLPKHFELPREELVKIKLEKSRGVRGVDLKLVGDEGQAMPWDGQSRGHLHVRGPWIASGHFKGEGGARLDAEGFFPNGDPASDGP